MLPVRLGAGLVEKMEAECASACYLIFRRPDGARSAATLGLCDAQTAQGAEEVMVRVRVIFLQARIAGRWRASSRRKCRRRPALPAFRKRPYTTVCLPPRHELHVCTHMLTLFDY